MNHAVIRRVGNDDPVGCYRNTARSVKRIQGVARAEPPGDDAASRAVDRGAGNGARSAGGRFCAGAGTGHPPLAPLRTEEADAVAESFDCQKDPVRGQRGRDRRRRRSAVVPVTLQRLLSRGGGAEVLFNFLLSSSPANHQHEKSTAVPAELRARRGFCRVKRRVAAIFRLMCTSPSAFLIFIQIKASGAAPAPANSSRQGSRPMRRSAGAGMAAQQA